MTKETLELCDDDVDDADDTHWQPMPTHTLTMIQTKASETPHTNGHART